MRHLLWIMPLMLAMGLMICCYIIPLEDNGREFLAFMFFIFSITGAFCVWVESKLERTV